MLWLSFGTRLLGIPKVERKSGSPEIGWNRCFGKIWRSYRMPVRTVSPGESFHSICPKSPASVSVKCAWVEGVSAR